MTLAATAWSHPLHHRFPAITWRVLAAEMDREISARLNTYPAQVERGRMTQAEADWQLQLARAWREDVERFEHRCYPLMEGRPAALMSEIPAAHGIAWRPRRAALLRELEQRQRFYPEWVEKGRLTQAGADSRIQGTECLLALYEFGLDWQPANGTLPAWDELHPTREQQATREEIRALSAEVAARAIPPQQEMFA